jgi:methylmalonyl-CoA mutase cobalamin-binding domain/chain
MEIGMSEELEKIKNLMGDLDEDSLLATVRQRIDAGDSPMAIIEACRDGMQVVGERFAKQEYFVSELVASGELFNEVMDIIGARLPAGEDSGDKQEIVLGTVQGDIHDIGKNIVVSMLRANGFKVHDMGIDVPPQVFVDKVKETGAKVLGLSGLLTVAFANMEVTIKALEKAGLRNKTRVIIGGGMVDQFVCDKVGADAWGHDAIEAVKLAKSLYGVK